MRQDKAKHYCGLMGVWGHPDAVQLTFLGLYALQHRGQESAGICTTDGRTLKRHADMGLVTEVFDAETLSQLTNPIAIGHVRYSTTGSCQAANAQPLVGTCAYGPVAVAHNGNLINATALRERFGQHGAVFTTSSDTEIILHLLAQPGNGGNDRNLPHALSQLHGAYSLLLLYPDRMVAVRDPAGFRPLVIGKLGNGALIFASETCALDTIDAEYVREVEPGEIVTVNATGMSSQWIEGTATHRRAHCIFEHVYFADPASDVFGQNVHELRQAMGAQLALEAPADADIVVPIPNCARCAARGYAKASTIPLERGFTTSHYMGRSFIMPIQTQRDLAVKLKLKVIRSTVRGKRLVVVEDSVVRGTTTRGKIGALRRAGAREIHLRVASPPIRHPCWFGIDFPTTEELIATNRSIEEIRQYLGVESLAYLSVDGMLSCCTRPKGDYCTNCFTGERPMPVIQPPHKQAMEP